MEKEGPVCFIDVACSKSKQHDGKEQKKQSIFRQFLSKKSFQGQGIISTKPQNIVQKKKQNPVRRFVKNVLNLMTTCKSYSRSQRNRDDIQFEFEEEFYQQGFMESSFNLDNEFLDISFWNCEPIEEDFWSFEPTEEESPISVPDIDTWEMLPTEIDESELPKQKKAGKCFMSLLNCFGNRN